MRDRTYVQSVKVFTAIAETYMYHGVDEDGPTAEDDAPTESDEDATEDDPGAAAFPFGALVLIRIVFFTTLLCTRECVSLPGVRTRQYGLRFDLSLLVASTKT